MKWERKGGQQKEGGKEREGSCVCNTKCSFTISLDRTRREEGEVRKWCTLSTIKQEHKLPLGISYLARSCKALAKLSVATVAVGTEF